MRFRLIKSKEKKLKKEDLSKEIAEAKKRKEYQNLKKKREKEQRKAERKRHKVEHFLTKAGFEVEPMKIAKKIFNIAIIINLFISAYLIFFFSTNIGYTLTYVIVIMIFLWVIAFAMIIFILWLSLYVLLDFKIMRRRLDLEEVLPDFLQLTASNIKSGMPIDQALWYAVRPRFGVLAKEVELIAKETMSGEDLDQALRKFSDKYDSPTLKRTISLLIEGLWAGGEIADLIMKIATDIQDTKIMKKEMAASVVTYVIFIGFATIAASPFLFGLAGQLITIVKNLSGSMELPPSVGGSIGISLTGGGINIEDFRIFAIVMLSITSFFSAAIISTIQKGNIKEGIRYIPIFMITTILLFFIISFGIQKLFAGLF